LQGPWNRPGSAKSPLNSSILPRYYSNRFAVTQLKIPTRSFEQNKRALDLLREAGIMTEASFMIGFPHETWDSIQRTIDSAIYLNPDVAVFPVVTPMPFTPIFDEMKDSIRVWDYSKYNLVTPIIEPDDMTMDEVTKALGQCYMKFYRRKIEEVLDLPDGYKKTYLISAMKLMMGAHGSNFDFAGSGMVMPHRMPI
jgi:anaerobic magnesium-protoporphyrin IX monomethyl ester cyclase